MILKIKNKINALFFWQLGIGDILNSMYGMILFHQFSFKNSKNFKNQNQHKAFLFKQYHIIEKGLALPKPRKNFGKAKIILLLEVANDYIIKYDVDEIIESIYSTLELYLKSNITLKSDDIDFYFTIQKFLNKQISSNGKGGVKQISINKNNINFSEFIMSRSSLRNFSQVPIDNNTIIKCIEDAKYTPSVCNRQSWKAHYYSDKIRILNLLKLQDGNSGFSESIRGLFVITSDLNSFTNLEYNQVYTEGGLFSMSLVLSLHSRNIGSCCLNLCVPFTKEKKIKKIGGITKSERLIMMIGIGYYNQKNIVSFSNRKSNDEILFMH